MVAYAIMTNNRVTEHPAIEGIRVRKVPACCACGAAGEPLYQGLRDRLSSVPGDWSLVKCSDEKCAMLWLNPMPEISEIGKLYPSDYYTHVQLGDAFHEPKVSSSALRRVYDPMKAGYLSLRYGYGSPGPSAKALGLLLYLHPHQRAKVDGSVMRMSGKDRKGRLLDVGCGGGGTMARLKQLGWKVEGIDVDPVAVDGARSLGLEVRLGTLEDRGYPENYFDAITMGHVIEHVTDPLSVLSHCFRILKPGGILSLATPNVESWGHRRFGFSWFALEPPRHLYLFTTASLTRLVREAGFRHVNSLTTIRGVNLIFITSNHIRLTGRFERSLGGLDLWPLRPTFTDLVEFGLRRVNPKAGEEIAMIATK